MGSQNRFVNEIKWIGEVEDMWRKGCFLNNRYD